MRIKNWEYFLNENINNDTMDNFVEGDVLFHGTSLKNYLKIKDNSFNVSSLYITTSEFNANEYAWITSDKGDDEIGDVPVLIVLNYEFLDGLLIDDIHDVDYTDGEFDLKQDGQYIFDGNIKKSIYHVISLTDKSIIDSYKFLKK